jgi:hypothetical protein
MLPDENQGGLLLGGLDLRGELRDREGDSRSFEPQARGELDGSLMASAGADDGVDAIGDEVLIRVPSASGV